MHTVRYTVRDALREIKRYGRGQNLNADDAEDSRRAMNQMLARWSTVGVVVPTLTKQTAALTVGQQEYTVGVGQDLVIARPTSIEELILISGNERSPLERVNVSEYARYQSSDSGLPIEFTYQYDTVGRLYLNCPPDKAYTAEFWSNVPLSTFSSINDDMSVAFGDADIEAVTLNLAIKLASQFGAKVSDSLASGARSAYKAIGIRYTEPMVYKS